MARADAAPASGDLRYAALRCEARMANQGSARDREAARQAFAEAALRWPKNGWLRNAVAHDKMAAGDFAGAVPDLQASRQELPALRPYVNLMLARIQRFQQGWMDYAGLSPASANLRWLSELEDGYGPENSETRAYAQLNKGALAAALAMGDGTPSGARLLRLAAASDGAGPNTLRRALDLPVTQGVDNATVWPSAALAMRNGRDAGPYLSAARQLYGESYPGMAAFLQALQRGKRQAEAEAQLGAVEPEARLQAYSAAAVLLGPAAPPAWRLAAKRMLFAPERPYFR